MGLGDIRGNYGMCEEGNTIVRAIKGFQDGGGSEWEGVSGGCLLFEGCSAVEAKEICREWVLACWLAPEPRSW